jgi:hypothetical protein
MASAMIRSAAWALLLLLLLVGNACRSLGEAPAPAPLPRADMQGADERGADEELAAGESDAEGAPVANGKPARREGPGPAIRSEVPS